MPDVTSRFTIDGTDYDYEADVVTVQWQEDSASYRRLDGVMERDIREYKAIISFETVLVSENANASGTSAVELYDLIRDANVNNNTVTFVPDTSASAPNSPTPSVDVVTQPPPPQAYELEQGADRLRRSLTLQSDWLDPTVTADKDLIDDLNSLDTTL